MTWLALRALLSRAPRIAYVIAFAIALIAAGLWFTYRAGAKHEAIKAHQHAIADSIEKEEIVSKIAREQTDSTLAVARFATRAADASRPQRKQLRDSVETMLAGLPKPVVDLIHMDDQQIRRDSVAIVAHVAAAEDFLQERAIVAQVDTLRQHQATIGLEPPKHHGRRYAIAGVVLTIGAFALYHAVR